MQAFISLKSPSSRGVFTQLSLNGFHKITAPSSQRTTKLRFSSPPSRSHSSADLSPLPLPPLFPSPPSTSHSSALPLSSPFAFPFIPPLFPSPLAALSQEFEVCGTNTVRQEFLSAFKEEMEVKERLEKLHGQSTTSNGKDDLIRRPLVNYIMAFPVVLKVCYLSELVRSCSGFKAPVHLTSFRWRKVVKRALWREEKERERERPRDLAGWYQRYWHKNCQRRCGSRWSVVIVGLVPYPAMDPDTPISTAFVENGMHWTMYVVSTGAILSICASLLGAILPRKYSQGVDNGRKYSQGTQTKKANRYTIITNHCVVDVAMGFLNENVLHRLKIHHYALQYIHPSILECPFSMLFLGPVISLASNRQIVTLLSALGVPAQVFDRMQTQW
ncbi:Cationic amino acid transporter 3 [Carex littledalei]|uniref:Cationic amino acid transporter 3 n=1 Tax=Carex littledalei TaxID=544730 RepID=A0A833QXE6_9POAL|nr:Cationic amino acid transporter 3 [Carex littledalei]